MRGMQKLDRIVRRLRHLIKHPLAILFSLQTSTLNKMFTQCLVLKLIIHPKLLSHAYKTAVGSDLI